MPGQQPRGRSKPRIDRGQGPILGVLGAGRMGRRAWKGREGVRGGREKMRRNGRGERKLERHGKKSNQRQTHQSINQFDKLPDKTSNETTNSE